jgi:hypothetical protein
MRLGEKTALIVMRLGGNCDETWGIVIMYLTKKSQLCYNIYKNTKGKLFYGIKEKLYYRKTQYS